MNQHLRRTPTRLADGRELVYFDDSPAYVAGELTRRLDDPRPLGDRFAAAMAEHPTAKIHTYGKDPRPGRKVGHVTVAAADLDEAAYEARAAAAHFDACRP